MSTELVPVDDMAAVEALPVEARELAVIQMLSEARSWLSHAVEASEPQSIANFKAQMATVAEATKQLGLSKEIQMDAQEMVRRAERGVGLAIRKGQVEGTVATRHEMKSRATAVREVNQGRLDQQVLNPLMAKPKPTDLAPSADLTGNGAGIYAMTDGVSDERFDEALSEAKSEENLSRANVVRKVRGQASPLSGEKRLDRIAELANKGWTSDAIGRDIGHGEPYIRRLARKNDIPIPGDVALGNSRRKVDHDRIAQETVNALEGLVLGLQLLNLDEVDRRHMTAWATSLSKSLPTLNRFHNQIKEIAHGRTTA